MVDIPHVEQSGAARLAHSTLNDFDTLNVRVEDLNGHLDTNTGELVPQQDGGVDAAQLDAQDDTVERVAILEGNPDNVTGLDTASVSSVIK